jgi:hypothetical protein
VEYGLMASKAFEITADFFWQLRAVWNSTPLWAIIVAGLGIATAVRLFFRTK